MFVSSPTLAQLLRWMLLLTALLLGLACLSLLIGSGHLGMKESLAYLAGDTQARTNEQLSMVIQSLRAPRTLATIIVGACLGSAGVLLQTATRNPLAESGLLGVNAGAALGVVIGISFANAQDGYAYLLWAFGGALLGNGLVLLVASRASALKLVLAGVAISATFQGLSSYLLLSNISSFDQYRFWVLGSLSGVSLSMTLQLLPISVFALLLALIMARPLSALLLGDDSARALGHNPTLTRSIIALTVTLMSGIAVALAGPLVFLGIVAPYAARHIVGPRIASQILLAALIGALVLLSADILARLVIRPFDSPVGVILAFIGAPFLILLVRSSKVSTI